MPQFPLDALQTALGAAYGQLSQEISARADRFDRYAEKKKARHEREKRNARNNFFRALGESLGLPVIPANAVVYQDSNGKAVLSWPDPPKPPEKKPENSTGGTLESDPVAAPDPVNTERLAPVTKMPENGVPAHAGAT